MPQLLKTLADAIAIGDYKPEVRSIAVEKFDAQGARTWVQVDSHYVLEFVSGDALARHPIQTNHYRCPGCDHWRQAFALVDCRAINDPALVTKTGVRQLWYCDGCSSELVFRAGRRVNLYEQMADAVIKVGANSTFKNRADLLRDRVRRAGKVTKAIDDVLDPLADFVLPEAPTIEALRAKNGDAFDNMTAAERVQYELGAHTPEFFSENIAAGFMLNRKKRDGILLLDRQPRVMTHSLWLELHNAPAPFVAKFKGRPEDFFLRNKRMALP